MAVVLAAGLIASLIVLTRSNDTPPASAAKSQHGQCPRSEPVKALIIYDASTGPTGSTLHLSSDQLVAIDGVSFTAEHSYVTPSDPQYAQTPAQSCFRNSSIAERRGFSYYGNVLAAAPKQLDPGPPAQRICVEQAASFLTLYGDLGSTPQSALQAKLPIPQLGAATNSVLTDVISQFGGNVITAYAHSAGQETPSFNAVVNAVINGCTSAVVADTPAQPPTTSSTGSTPANSSAFTSSPPRTVSVQVVNCSGQPPATRPTVLYLSCADGGMTITQLSWQSFGGATASGSGVINVNDCNPDCADGRTTSDPVKVTLSSVSSSSGRPLYTHISAIPKFGDSIEQSLPG